MKKIMTLLTTVCCIVALITPMVHAEVTDEEVLKVIAQLESIDSLQTMQDNRATYAVPNNYIYDLNDADKMSIQNEQKQLYETYLSEMFALREKVKEAYESLDESQKSQIDASLVSKLTEELDIVANEFASKTYAVNVSNNEYTHQLIAPNFLSYEISTLVSKGLDMPAIMMLVDTRESGTSFTPNGRYEYGKSNYDVVYCCDAPTAPKNGNHYRLVNLEDTTYYSDASARHIRTIVENSYPFVSIEEMKNYLIETGLDEQFVESLNRSDIIAGVQMAIWAFSNNDLENLENVIYYGGTMDATNNASIKDIMYDYTNELWTWWSTKGRTCIYDASSAYKLNTLVHYLCHLEGTEANDDEIIINDVKVSRAQLLNATDELFDLGMYVHLNAPASSQDHLRIVATSVDDYGNITDQVTLQVKEQTSYPISLKANSGDTIKVVVKGTQYVEKGVYFYEPEGGYSESQAFVGVDEGEVEVYTKKEFLFDEEVEKGLRIYKTSTDGLPISNIIFDIYRVNGEISSATASKEEVEKYAIESNLVASVTTDVTGYANAALENGTYLVIERENEQVKQVVTPFYIQIPMDVEVQTDEGVKIETVTVVSVYPKNELVKPDDDIDVPEPDNVLGYINIVKHDVNDETKYLKDAKFKVYKVASEENENTEILEVGKTSYIVEEVLIDDEELVLVTNEKGQASSPALPAGDYLLVETHAPDGYNLLNEPVLVTVNSYEYSQEVIYIANTLGASLPFTGSKGNSLFIIAGSIIMLGTGIFLVSKKYMKYEE